MGWIKTPEEKAAARQKRLDKGLFKDDTRKVIAALDAGANPNARNEYGYSAISYQASSRRNEAVKVLLERGADPNGKTDNDYSPLMAAASHNDVELAKLLCAHGANINAQSHDGRTPLHHAAYWGRGKIIQFLLSQGADTTLRDGRMNSAADIAAKENYPGVAALLRGELDEVPKEDNAPTVAGWHLTAPDEIARIDDKPAIGYRITEIFNFGAGVYNRIARNLATDHESQSMRLFDEMHGSTILQQAAEAFVRLGGDTENAAAAQSLTAKKPAGLTLHPSGRSA